MENETDRIREQMTETRTALTEKLEALQEKVVSTVEGTTTTVAETVGTVAEKVQDTVNNVSESVHETVKSVKSAFDLTGQTQEHPWAMFGGAVAVGYLGGCLLPPLGSAAATAGQAGAAGESIPSSTRASFATGAPAPTPSPPWPAGATPAQTAEPGWLASLAEQLAPAARQLQGMALGAMTGLVGQAVLRSIPDNFRPQVADWIDELTRSLGGKPIQGLKESFQESAQHQAPGQQARQQPPPPYPEVS
jgi:ElaB/YqjD/DUF883 family membrane-anchored ribosome-binding protein